MTDHTEKAHPKLSARYPGGVQRGVAAAADLPDAPAGRHTTIRSRRRPGRHTTIRSRRAPARWRRLDQLPPLAAAGLGGDPTPGQVSEWAAQFGRGEELGGCEYFAGRR
ncbi:hypothetical protein [Nonomuraea sp. B19D2]|uniref:hypothetical protein n=1 Tax=Nonomuraea sp. B19D2 TaxID=3159561 RepID=UPI0032DB84D0